MGEAVLSFVGSTLIVLLAAAPAGLAHTFTGAGTILLGNPGTIAGLGLTELAGNCDTASPFQGLDGAWFFTPGYTGHTAVLTMVPTLDADAYFYTSTCGLLGETGCAAALVGTTEICLVPALAAYVIVDGFVGQGSFALTIG